MATIFCFTAFVAQIADLSSFETSNYAHRWSSQLVAGVSSIITYTYIFDTLAQFYLTKGNLTADY